MTQENKNIKNHDITDHQISDNRSRMTNATNLVDKAPADIIDEKEKELKEALENIKVLEEVKINLGTKLKLYSAVIKKLRSGKEVDQ